MHKNLNFERFWKCVQINFFCIRVDVHTRSHLILAPLIPHTFSGESRTSRWCERGNPAGCSGAAAAVRLSKYAWLKGLYLYSFPITGRDTSDSTMRRICHRLILPLCGRCDASVSLSTADPVAAKRKLWIPCLPVASHNWSTSQGTPNPLYHIYFMLGDGRRPFWRYELWPLLLSSFSWSESSYEPSPDFTAF